MRFLLSLLLLLPTVAAAQTTLTLGYATGQNTSNAGNTLTLGQGDCAETVTVTWTFPQNVCNPLAIWVVNPDTPCSDVIPSSNLFRTNVPVADVNAAAPPAGGVGHTETVTFTLDQVFAAVAPTTGGVVRECGRADVQETRRFLVCGLATVLGGATGNDCSTKVASTPDELSLVYDHEKPNPPSPNVRGGDSKLIVTFPEDDTIASVDVEYRADGQTAFTPLGSGSPLEEFEISGLTNDTTYFVRATQTDLGGNVSDPSEEQPATPLEVFDFYERYQAAGGAETGGCGVAGGAGLSLGAALAVLGLWMVSRRRVS